VSDQSKETMISRSEVEKFDKKSGSFVERMLFNNRIIFLIFCAFITIFLGIAAFNVRINANFDQMIPIHQRFIVNYIDHYNELQSEANAVQIAVSADKGTIIDSNYLNILKNINDQVYLLPGVDRPFMTSIWTSNTRWIAVTPNGLDGGPVMGSSYDGSLQQLEIVRQNIEKTGKVGRLVSKDFKSSMIYVPLLEKNNLTEKPLNYGDLARQLTALKKQYAPEGVTLHITGFAMVVGDMINGINVILAFFLVSIIIATTALFYYTRCVRSTVLVVSASLTAVMWQMGILSFLGFGLTPYSVLVPFLVFAIGVSHGAQKMNGVMQDIGRGTPPLIAARYTFRRLFLAGFAALICDVTSFAVLLTIKIDAIRQLATTASIGVGLLVITNLMMLPIMLSYTGVDRTAAQRSLHTSSEKWDAHSRRLLWRFLDLFTKQNFAVGALMFAFIISSLAFFVGSKIQIGDLHSGAPELRPHSTYNLDSAYISKNFTSGNDTFIVMVDTPAGECLQYNMLSTMNRLQWRLQQLPVVQSTNSLASFSAYAIMLMTENSPKWFGLEPNQPLLNSFLTQMPASLMNFQCNFAPIYVSLTDHKAKTLNTIVDMTSAYINDPKNKAQNFVMSLAGGSAGIEAATNIVIRQANRNMLILVYAVVIIFCFITFRSWRAVLCAVIPLMITSVMAQALMVIMGIGIKVATLPVIALGVGIGVDYALYVLSIILKNLRLGVSLSDAYYRTLLFTGRVVILTGITLATGVITWIFAPIKFQADMGLLLAFMFIWNMFGAMVLLPALAYFLLPPRLFKGAQARQHEAGA
jgi:predicted RND superfamily exporter protein